MLDSAVKSSSEVENDSGQPDPRRLPIYTIIVVVLLVVLTLISLLRKPAADSRQKRDTGPARVGSAE